MKQLIKPIFSLEDYREEIVQAFCDRGGGCSPNCRLDTIVGCWEVGEVSADDEILF